MKFQVVILKEKYPQVFIIDAEKWEYVLNTFCLYYYKSNHYCGETFTGLCQYIISIDKIN